MLRAEFTTELSQAPEPGTMLVLGLGLVGLGVMRRRTPLGQTLIRTMPRLLGELTAFGAVWGRDIAGRLAGERVKEKLRERGYEL